MPPRSTVRPAAALARPNPVPAGLTSLGIEMPQGCEKKKEKEEEEEARMKRGRNVAKTIVVFCLLLFCFVFWLFFWGLLGRDGWLDSGLRRTSSSSVDFSSVPTGMAAPPAPAFTGDKSTATERSSTSGGLVGDEGVDGWMGEFRVDRPGCICVNK